MKFKDFEKVVTLLKEQSDREGQALELDIDLLEFNDKYNQIIDVLIRNVYGDEGWEWFGWFCYENDFGRGDLDAYESFNGKIPICYDIPSLYDFLETNYNKTINYGFAKSTSTRD